MPTSWNVARGFSSVFPEVHYCHFLALEELKLHTLQRRRHLSAPFLIHVYLVLHSAFLIESRIQRVLKVVYNTENSWVSSPNRVGGILDEDNVQKPSDCCLASCFGNCWYTRSRSG
jgi:hypothetical protein